VQLTAATLPWYFSSSIPFQHFFSFIHKLSSIQLYCTIIKSVFVAVVVVVAGGDGGTWETKRVGSEEEGDEEGIGMEESEKVTCSLQHKAIAITLLVRLNCVIHNQDRNWHLTVP